MNSKNMHTMLEFLGIVLLLGQSFCMVQGDVHFYDFVLREKNFTRLCNTKSMLVVNDSFPGPVIQVHKGDTVYVNVHNQGYYGVTLHWHGVKQPRNPWSDGPEYITQCPIQPGSNFTYEVIFSDEEGTLWWHAHSDWTRATVHGAIVILPPVGSTYPFANPDEEEIVVLAAWYKGDLKELVDEALETGTDLPHSNAYTINGEPGDFCACSNGTTYRWMVDYGKTYLLRVVNAVMNAELFFAVAGHNLTVVGMDGHYIKPISTSYIMISPGQTMNVLLTANQPLGHYYIAARQYSSEDPAVTGFDHVNTTAILQYRGNYTITSSPSFPSTLPLYLDFIAASNFTNRIRSLANKDYPINVPLNITKRMYITVSMNSLYCSTCSGGNDSIIGTSMNNISWLNPSTDVLHAYYRNISGVFTRDFPDYPPSFYNFTGDEFSESIDLTVQGTKVKVLNYGEVVEIVFQGTNVLKGSVNHPMHLHGYSFYVVGTGANNFDNETDPKGFNLVDPPEVNTFGVPKKGWLAIRFVANNPGVWFWHCHLDRHMSWGMNTVFIVKNGATTESSIRQPPVYMPSCKVPLNYWIQNNDGLDEEVM
ncbi:laccase-14-like isoform X1 [Alnus glutinosa]|uniref:laccase-14-like isoform X1 n=2 Tax=Alnus glutinosa TaxID=3517 RepID=UPI002D7955ED|nr:laccase-14-like isoform X1 [Alnus glutinosa]